MCVLGAGSGLGPPSRITRVGQLIRRYSLDELPTLINVLTGDLTLMEPVFQYIKVIKKSARRVIKRAASHLTKDEPSYEATTSLTISSSSVLAT